MILVEQLIICTELYKIDINTFVYFFDLLSDMIVFTIARATLYN